MTTSDLGDYDECLATHVPPKILPVIRGTKYCLARIDQPYKFNQGPVTPALQRLFQERFNGTFWVDVNPAATPFFILNGWYFGTCFPSACTAQQFGLVLNGLLKPYLSSTNVIMAPDGICDTQNDPVIEWTWWQVLAG